MKGLIRVQRKIFNTGKTENERDCIGEMFLNGEYFCYTLEDELRADGEKVYGKTAIAADEYEWEVTYSNTFKRDMILIKDVPMFKGIRIHGGNDAENSKGCVLCAYNTDTKKIWGTAEKALTAWAKEQGSKGVIIIENKPFSSDGKLTKTIV